MYYDVWHWNLDFWWHPRINSRLILEIRNRIEDFVAVFMAPGEEVNSAKRGITRDWEFGLAVPLSKGADLPPSQRWLDDTISFKKYVNDMEVITDYHINKSWKHDFTKDKKKKEYSLTASIKLHCPEKVNIPTSSRMYQKHHG